MSTRALLLTLLVVVTACGSDRPATVTTAPVHTTSTMHATTTTTRVTDEPAPTTTVPASTTTVVTVDVELVDGEISGPGTFQFDLGDTVSIVVLSDVDDEIHVHGYDLFFDVVAGTPVTVEFTADVPGVFEVEVHTGHTHLFDIEVSG